MGISHQQVPFFFVEHTSQGRIILDLDFFGETYGQHEGSEYERFRLPLLKKPYP